MSIETGITIIMPTYNRAHIIMDAVNSVVRQTFKDWTLIVVDDCSTDDTEKIVHSVSDPRVKYYRLPANNGAAYCRNFGLRMTQTPFVGFLDSDDVFHREKLDKHLALLREGLDCTVSYCERHYQGSDVNEMLSDVEPRNNLIVEFIDKRVTWKMYPIWVTEFLRKNEVYFHEGLKNSQDYQFNALAIMKRPRVGYIRSVLGIKNEYASGTDPGKIGGKKMGPNTLKGHLLSRQLILRYAERENVSHDDLSAIKKYIRRHRLSCFKIAFGYSLRLLVETVLYSVQLWRSGPHILQNPPLRG